MSKICKLYSIFFFCVFVFTANADSLQQPAEQTSYTDEIEIPSMNKYSLDALKKDTIPVLQKKFAPDFKDKYDSSDFDYTYERQSKRSLIEQWIQKIKEFFGFVDRNTVSTESFFDSTLFRIISLVIIALILAYIIKLLIQNDFNRFFKKSPKDISVETINIEEQIHKVDFEKMLQPILRTEDYRLAIRYYYLWVLRRLSNAEVIKWHTDKTNADYLFEIKDQQLKKDFEYLSYLYNNIWYGKFTLTSEEFLKAQEAFITLLNRYKNYE